MVAGYYFDRTAVARLELDARVVDDNDDENSNGGNGYHRD